MSHAARGVIKPLSWDNCGEDVEELFDHRQSSALFMTRRGSALSRVVENPAPELCRCRGGAEKAVCNAFAPKDAGRREHERKKESHMLLREKFPGMFLTKGFVLKSCFAERKDLTKRLIEVILDVQMDEVEITHREHELNPIEDRAAGYLDIYARDVEGNEYDIEAQIRNNHNEILRARRYHALMDAERIKRGDTNKLGEVFHKSIVIFICDFDPFGDGLPLYDTFMHCVQTGRVVDDGRRATYLNTTAKAEGDLGHLIRYVTGEADEDEWDDPLARGIVEELEKAKNNPEWMEAFMTIEEELHIVRESALREGMELGVQKVVRLASALREAGRENELESALNDRETLDVLLAEFHID